MAGAGGLLVFFVGVLLGVLFALVAIGVLIYASRVRHPGRGYVASLIALVLALASVIVALPVTHLVLSGSGAHGESFPAGAIGTALVFVCVQALAVLASIFYALRHRARRRLEGVATQVVRG